MAAITSGCSQIRRSIQNRYDLDGVRLPSPLFLIDMHVTLFRSEFVDVTGHQFSVQFVVVCLPWLHARSVRSCSQLQRARSIEIESDHSIAPCNTRSAGRARTQSGEDLRGPSMGSRRPEGRKMGTKVVLAVAVALMAMLVAASGQCPPATQFAPCLPFVTSPTARSPSKGDPCCKLVLTLSSVCLCNAAKNPNPVPGVTVNFQKALTLPKACGRSVPPHTVCNGTPVPSRR